MCNNSSGLLVATGYPKGFETWIVLSSDNGVCDAASQESHMGVKSDGKTGRSLPAPRSLGLVELETIATRRGTNDQLNIAARHLDGTRAPSDCEEVTKAYA